MYACDVPSLERTDMLPLIFEPSNDLEFSLGLMSSSISFFGENLNVAANRFCDALGVPLHHSVLHVTLESPQFEC